MLLRVSRGDLKTELDLNENPGIVEFVAAGE